MPVNLKFKEDARNSLLEGAELIKEAVAATLGPRGRNVAIDRKWGTPRVVHDGVTVARSVKSKERDQDMGIMLMQEAAGRTNEEAGDGTTTAIVMAHAIFAESIKHVVAGSNPMMIRKGINKATEAVLADLKNKATPVETDEETAAVATVSAQDEEIGKLISAAVKKVGRTGVVTVDESDTSEIEVEYKAGMQFDQGLISPYLVTDERSMESTVEKPLILVTDYALSNAQQAIKLLDKLVTETSKTKFTIIAKDISSGALNDLIMNHRKGAIQVQLIKAPHSGDRQTRVLEDIAVYSGAVFVSESKGDKLDEVVAADLGSAKRVVAGRKHTVIIDGDCDEGLLEERVELLDADIADKKTKEYDRKFLEERKAKLSSGIAVIKVGANSDAEKDEKKERVIDAVSATRSAIEEGVVPGGETALLFASNVLNKLKGSTSEEQMGIDIVKRACEAPFKRLLENAGIDPGMALAKLDAVPFGIGFNVVTQKVEDLTAAGIIDPVKVTRSALRNATSTATMMLTTNVLVVLDEEETQNGQQ